jgi:hypothetical protein
MMRLAGSLPAWKANVSASVWRVDFKRAGSLFGGNPMPPRRIAKREKNMRGLVWFTVAALLAGAGQALFIGSQSFQTGMLVGGWGCMALAAGALFLQRRGQDVAGDPDTSGLTWKWEAMLLAGILGLALTLRLVNLDVQPNAGFRDECEYGNVAILMLNGEKVYDTGTSCPVYIEFNIQNAAGYFYPLTAAYKIFGIGVKSGRYVSVFFGTLSIAAFYLLARLLMGAPVALLMALALTFLRWHLNFSRIGFLGMMTLFIMLPTLYFLWKGLWQERTDELKGYKDAGLLLSMALLMARLCFDTTAMGGWGNVLTLGLSLPLIVFLYKGLKDRQSTYLMLAAGGLGLTLYTYLASRLLVVVVAGMVAYVFLQSKGVLTPARKKILWAAACLLGLGAALIVEGSARRLGWMGGLGLGMVGLSGLLVWGGMLATFPVSAAMRVSLSLLALAGVFGIYVAGKDESQIARSLVWSGRIAAGLGAFGMLVWVGSLSQKIRASIRPYLLAAGAVLLVGAPLMNFMVVQYDQLFSRSQRVSIFNDRELEGDNRPWGAKLKENIPITLGMYNVRGDANPRHNLPNEIMLNPFLAAVFGAAAIFLLARALQPLPFFLLLWWQAMLLGGYFSQEAPQAYRTIGAIPVVVLMAGLGFKAGWDAFVKAWGRTGMWLGGALLLALVLIGGVYELRSYFIGQATHSGCWAEFSATEYLIGEELHSHPNTHGLMRSDWSDSWTVKFTTYPERDYSAFDPSRDVPLRQLGAATGKNVLYILGDTYLPLLPVLKGFYPNGIYRESRHPFTRDLLYWSFYVSEKDIQAAAGELKNGLTAYYYKDQAAPVEKGDSSVQARAPHWQSATLRFCRIDPFILFDWTVDPIQGPFSVEWKGKLKVDEDGLYNFHTKSNDYLLLEIDGKKIIERLHEPAVGMDYKGSAHLKRGMHTIRMRYYEARNYSRVELWWNTPSNRVEALVPSQNLFPESNCR